MSCRRSEGSSPRPLRPECGSLVKALAVLAGVLSVLGVGGALDYFPSIRNFDPLPDAIREQASRGRLLSDPEWGTYLDDPRTDVVPFIDITDRYERSYAQERKRSHRR